MLKFVYDNAADIPEGLKNHYKEVDGKWHLQCSGAKPQAEFDTMQTSLTAARTDVTRFKAVVAKFGEHTPETIATLEEEVAGLKVGDKDIEAQVAAMVEVRTKNLTRDLTAMTQRAEKSEGDLTGLRGDFSKSKIDVAVMNVANGMVRDTAVEDVLLHAGLDLELDESGNVVTKETCKAGAALSVKDWLAKKLETSVHWEPESTPGKSKGGKGGNPPVDNPWAKETFNVTQQHVVMQSDPSKAEALKKAAGVAA